MKRKILTVLLALVMAFGLLAVTAGATEPTGPVEVWTGYSGTRVCSHSTIADAVTNLGENKWIVIGKDYTLTEDFTIPEGVFLDVAAGATLTVNDGVTLTVAANAKRLGVRTDAAVVNNGTILVCGTSQTNGFVMVQSGGTLDINTLTPQENYILDTNGYGSYYSAKPFFEITYSNGTTKKVGAELSSAALSGATKATMLSDVADFAKSFNSTDKLADNFVLDLGGYTLTGKATASGNVLSTSVPMTIQNGTIRYASSNANFGALYTSADVTIASSATIDGGAGYGIWTDGYGHTLTVNGTVTCNGSYAITGNGSENGGLIADCSITVNDGAVISAPNGIAIYHPEKGTVTINGGTISGHTGVEMCAGKLIVTGGEITASGNNEDVTGSQNAILDGAAISIINRSYPGGIPTAEITGGKITANGTGALAVKAYDYTNDTVATWTDAGEHVSISGGTFSSSVSHLVADSHIQDANDNTVKPRDVSNSVAKIGDTYYGTLAGAVAAAQDGQTVVLVKYTELTGNLVVNKNITLNLNGLRIETNGHNIQVSKNMTVTGDGTLNSGFVPAMVGNVENRGTIFTVSTAGNLTIENGTYTTKGAQIIFAQGKVTVHDGRFENTATEVNSVLDSSSMIFALGTDAYVEITKATVVATAESANAGIYGIYGANGAHITLGEGVDVHTSLAAIAMNNTTSNPEVIITINGGKYQSECQQLNHAKYSKFNAVCYLPGKCQLIINGGTFTAGNDSMHIFSIPYAEAGMNLKITDGTFSASKDIFYSENGNHLNQTTANIISVSGGKFTGTLATFNENNNFEDFVSGGTFNHEVQEDYCAEGFIPKENGDSTYGVEMASTAVAVILDAQGNPVAAYDSLAEAIAALPFNTDGTAPATATTIQLRKDTNGGFDFGSGPSKVVNAVLDLNGNTLTLGPAVGSPSTETNGIRVLAYSKLEIKNGTIKCSDEISSTGRKVKVGLANYGTAVLEDVAFQSGKYDIWTINNRGSLTLKGSTTVETGANSDPSDNPDLTRAAINNTPYNYYYDVVNATINVADAGVKVGKIVLNDESISSTTNINGKAELNISAGTFGEISETKPGNGIIGSISGGTFASAVKEDYCAEGFIPAANDDGTYGVKQGAYVAEIDGVKYESLQDAVDAVQDGETITILKDVETATVSKTVSFTVAVADGVTFEKDSIAAGANTTVDVTGDSAPYTYAFTYTPVPAYSVKVAAAENGSVTSNRRSATRGQTVTLTVSPADGYALDTLTVTDAKGNEIELADKGDGKYTFKMPASRVTVTATFKKVPVFTDIDGRWFTEAIEWAAEQGIALDEDGSGLFRPMVNCSRAAIVTFLWRAFGSQEPTITECPFTDVSESDPWYKAVLWAYENKITVGYDSTTVFAPNATSERAQTLTFLKRAVKAADVATGNDFTDVPEGAWFEAAVNWAVSEGLTNGYDDPTVFMPRNDCSRAEIIAFIYRLLAK